VVSSEDTHDTITKWWYHVCNSWDDGDGFGKRDVFYRLSDSNLAESIVLSRSSLSLVSLLGGLLNSHIIVGKGPTELLKYVTTNTIVIKFAICSFWHGRKIFYVTIVPVST